MFCEKVKGKSKLKNYFYYLFILAFLLILVFSVGAANSGEGDTGENLSTLNKTNNSKLSHSNEENYTILTDNSSLNMGKTVNDNDSEGSFSLEKMANLSDEGPEVHSNSNNTPSVNLVNPPDNSVVRSPRVNLTVIVNDTSSEEINVTFREKYSCYQETPNVSTECGGLGTGSYGYTQPGEPVGIGYAYMNYSKPSNVIEAKWKVSHGGDRKGKVYNITIPQACFNQPKITLRIISDGYFPTDYSSQPQCYNGSNWTSLGHRITGENSAVIGCGHEFRLFDGDWDTGAIWYGEGYDCWHKAANWDNEAVIYEEAMFWIIDGRLGERNVLSGTESSFEYEVEPERDYGWYVLADDGNNRVTSDIWSFSSYDCLDNDSDGFYSMPKCGSLVDCNDNNASVMPPANGLDISKNIKFCSGEYNVSQRMDIVSDNVVVDCNGSKLYGNYSNGAFRVSSYDNVTIKNCNLSNYTTGIFLHNSEGNKIRNNNFTMPSSYAIRLFNSDKNKIYSNKIISINRSEEGVGIGSDSNGNEIYDNEIKECWKGISISESKNNSVYGNAINDNYWGIYSGANETRIEDNNFVNNMESAIFLTRVNKNMVRDNYMWSNITSEEFAGHMLHIQRGGNNSIINNTLEGHHDGILVQWTDNNYLKGNEVRDNVVGLNIDESNRTLVKSMVANNPEGTSILIKDSRDNIVEEATIFGSRTGLNIRDSEFNNVSGSSFRDGQWAVLISGSKYNEIKNNKMENNTWGVKIKDGINNTVLNSSINKNIYGIYLDNSEFNLINNNDINNNTGDFFEDGGGVVLEKSDNNSILGNKIIKNDKYGIALYYNSSGNVINRNSVYGSEVYEIRNYQSSIVEADENYWGRINREEIDSGIYDDEEGKGEVIFTPFLCEECPTNQTSPCLEGDVNGDCVVDIFDLASVGQSYGLSPGDPNWVSNADLDGDGDVDIFDLALVGQNYYSTC